MVPDLTPPFFHFHLLRQTVECTISTRCDTNDYLDTTTSALQCAFCRVSSGKGTALAKWILGVSNFFVVVWAIVGIFSILQFHYDEDCREVNPLLWNLAWAVVAVSFLVCCCGGFVGYSVRTAEPEVVHEDVEQPRQSRR